MTMPHHGVWDDARTAFDAVTDDHTPSEDGEKVGAYQRSPETAQRAIDALGDLLGIYDGYGEDDPDA